MNAEQQRQSPYFLRRTALRQMYRVGILQAPHCHRAVDKPGRLVKSGPPQVKGQSPVRPGFPADDAIKIRVQNGLGQGQAGNLRLLRNHQPLGRIGLIFIANRPQRPNGNPLRLPPETARRPEVFQSPPNLLFLRTDQPKTAGDLVVSHRVIAAHIRHHPVTGQVRPGRIVLRRSPDQGRGRKTPWLRHHAVSGKYRPVSVPNQINHSLPAPNLPAPPEQALSVATLYPAPEPVVNKSREGGRLCVPSRLGQRKNQHRSVVLGQRLPSRPDGKPLRRSQIPRLLPGRNDKNGLGRVITCSCRDIHVKSVPIAHVRSPPITACFSGNCRRTGRSPPPGKGRVLRRNRPQRWRRPPLSPERGIKARSVPGPRLDPVRPGR